MSQRTVLVVFFLFLLTVACTDNQSSDSSVTATEKWELTIPETQNKADITLNLHENGKITCSGNWSYIFFGDTISCTIMSGTGQKDSSHLEFTCTGKASYPPNSSGYVESSPFTLNISGNFVNGDASGNWSIIFTNKDWQGWEPDPGKFSGSLLEGSSVTDIN
ncbi:MAG TPA: hypothetical protein VKY57_17650 [Chitinispirillaceae bacterium]|jgi:hypothetical protein|nr:hypothetical protein [Chitinispirillaceae bacterium]